MGEWMPVVVTAALAAASLALALLVLRGYARARTRRRDLVDASVGGGMAVDSVPPSGAFRLPADDVSAAASTTETSP